LSALQRKDLYISDRWHLSKRGHQLYAEASLPALQQFILAPRAADKKQP
jgi:hypothetical protein